MLIFKAVIVLLIGLVFGLILNGDGEPGTKGSIITLLMVFAILGYLLAC
jgi:hypothetical protein